MQLRTLCTLALAWCCAAAQGAPADLVLVAQTDLTMPIAQFQDGQLAGGILKDLGDAIAQRLGRRIDYLSVEVENVTSTLKQGRADGLCYVMPFWISGDYNWSSPLIPDEELIAASEDAPVVHALSELRDQPIGTITRYRYPRVEQVLGAHFVRSDSPSMEKNLRQMMSGAVQYTIINQSALTYALRHDKSIRLRPDLVFSTFKAQCAFTLKAPVPFADINRAIDSLLNDGSVERILARYR